MLDAILAVDASVFLWVNSLTHPAWLTAVMNAVSTLATGSAVWLLLALAVAVKGNPAGAFRMALAIVLTATVVNGFIKPQVGRDRPWTTLETTEPYSSTLPGTASFPSGHAAGAAAAAYSVSRLSATPATMAAVWVLATLVALSRVYLGVHYPLDVAAGLVIGLGLAIFVTGGMICGTRDRRETVSG